MEKNCCGPGYASPAEAIRSPRENLLYTIAIYTGTGIQKPVLFKDLEILRDEKGKPYFNPLGDVKKTIINLGITKTHVSLADESEHAIAFAILEI